MPKKKWKRISSLFRKKRNKKDQDSIKTGWKPYAVLIFLVLFLNFFVLRLAFVNGSSMEPLLSQGECILVWQWGYEPEPGDIVITNRRNPYGVNLIKRVIGVAGQELCLKDQEIWRDGILLEEAYAVTQKGYQPLEITVPEDKVFLLGDNRDFSKDSREIGCIDKEDILGYMIGKF